MIDIVTTLSTNLFRTFILKKFMTIFFQEQAENRNREKLIYFLFFLATAFIHIMFHFPPANIIVNLLMIYAVTQIYEGEQKKKILVSLLIYGIHMSCDIVSVYSISDYAVGKEYEEISAYITVFLICICEFFVERCVVRRYREKDTGRLAPPYWNILILVPAISIVILFVLLMNNLDRRPILVTVSAGILCINILIFYLYDVLLDYYLRLEEGACFERQAAEYANQLDVLMESEEKMNALRHDMRHHLYELMILAEKDEKQDIAEYIQAMQVAFENKREYSACGNKEADSILNYMLQKAEVVLKQVEYKINIPKELEIRAFDMNILLGNLLENAVSAATDSEEKRLYVLMKYNKGMLHLHIQNSYAGKLIRQNGRYLTTKQEADGHGIGLQNVRRVVERYNGDMSISDENNIFDVKIMLYVKQDK